MGDRIKAGPLAYEQAVTFLDVNYHLTTGQARDLLSRARQSATGMAAQPTPEGAIWVSELLTLGGKFMIEFE